MRLRERIRALVKRGPGSRRQVDAIGVWWMRPQVIVLLTSVATVLPAPFIAADSYRQLWRMPKQIDVHVMVMILACLGMLILGATAVSIVPRQRVQERGWTWPTLTTGQEDLLERIAVVLGFFILAGYVAWAVSGATHGATVPMVLDSLFVTGADLEEYFPTVPGLSTLGQFGPAFVIICVLLMARRSKRLLALLIPILLLTTIRAIVNTERLAMLELLVPGACVLIMNTSVMSKTLRPVLRLLPVVFLPLLIVTFGAAEYQRTWKTFYVNTWNGTFPNFVMTRFLGYYVTSWNNADILITHTEKKGPVPYDTIAWFWNFPGISQMRIYERLSGSSDLDPGFTLLFRYGNPELNNTSGVAFALVDYGFIGALLFFLVLGVVSGLLYRSFAQGGRFGCLLYPIVFLTLAELPRYLYIGQGRSTPSVVALIAIAVAIGLQARRQEKRALAD